MASKPVAKPKTENTQTSPKVKSATAPISTATKAASRKPASPKTVSAKSPATQSPIVKAASKASVVNTKAAAPAIKVVNKTVTAIEKDKAKTSKVRMERDSFTMPKEEYAQIATLKKRLEALGKPAKKSELLRAGLKLLSAMDDAALQTTMASVPTIKTGRPKK